MKNKIVQNGLVINPDNTYESEKHVFFWGSYMSNWASCTFEHNGRKYNCSEQAMMAEKAILFEDLEAFKKIMASDDPSDQKAYGRAIKNYNEQVWSNYRYDIVVDILLAKFSQNEDFKERLLATGDKVIVESSSYDNVWGIAMHAMNPDIHDESKWRGQNLLGKALMQVRSYLRGETAFQ